MKKLFFIASILFAARAAGASDIKQPIDVKNWLPSQAITGTIAIDYPSLNVFSNVSLSTTPVHISGASIDFWGWYFYNNATAGNERSVKLCNTVAAPIVGTTIPDMTITVGGRSPSSQMLPGPITFSHGMWIFATTGAGSTSTGAPLPGEVSAEIFFQ